MDPSFLRILAKTINSYCDYREDVNRQKLRPEFRPKTEVEPAVEPEVSPAVEPAVEPEVEPKSSQQLLHPNVHLRYFLEPGRIIAICYTNAQSVGIRYGASIHQGEYKPHQIKSIKQAIRRTAMIRFGEHFVLCRLESKFFRQCEKSGEIRLIHSLLYPSRLRSLIREKGVRWRDALPPKWEWDEEDVEGGVRVTLFSDNTKYSGIGATFESAVVDAWVKFQ